MTANSIRPMSLNRIALFAHVFALTLLFIGCQKRASDEIDFGTLSDSIYTNKYFGFSVKLPKDWNVQDQDVQKRLMNTGAELVAGNDKNLKAMVKASELQSVNLFATFEHPVGSPVEFNPSIMSVAELTRDLPGIKRGKDYLFQAKKMLEAGQIKVSFPKDYYTAQLGGVEFDVMELEMSMVGMVIKQKYFVSVQKGYALCFIVSYTNDEQSAFLQTVLNSVAFN